MPRGRHRYDDDYSSSSSDDRYGEPILIERRDRNVRIKRPGSHHRHATEQPVYIKNSLQVPVQRHRANSAGAQPAPVIFMPTIERSRSRHDSSSRSHSRTRSHRGSTIDERDLPYELRRKMDLASEADEERRRHKFEEEEKARLLRQFSDKEREDKERRERLLRDIEDDRRKEDERRIRILREQDEKEREEKKKREELAEQIKYEAEKKKKEEKDLEERILLNAQFKKEKEEKEAKELKEKILREAHEEELKEKEKKKKEEKEFEEKIRARAYRHGWSDDYADDLIRQLKEDAHEKHRRNHSPGGILAIRDRTETLIDVDRPTWIRIHRKHILPETLDYYRLRWDWADDPEYIMIKEYIDHDFQRTLFDHSKRLMKSQKLITSGYEKETITTLKPRDERVIKKKGDQMYVVRRKSVSPGGRRLSSIFS